MGKFGESGAEVGNETGTRTEFLSARQCDSVAYVEAKDSVGDLGKLSHLNSNSSVLL
jgi:hypothetical protein